MGLKLTQIMKDFTEELILFIRRHKILALVVYTAAVMVVLTMTFSESNDERLINDLTKNRTRNCFYWFRVLLLYV